MIVLVKIYKRIKSIIKIFIWKVLYFNGFKVKFNTVFYPGTHLTIENKGKVEIGEHCFFNHNTSINSMGHICIGNNCIFGENVMIYDHNHNVKEGELIRKQGYTSKDIVIGNNCWIGSNVIILAGITIGNDVVIGAGTLVNKNIEDGCIVVNEKKIKMIKKMEGKDVKS